MIISFKDVLKLAGISVVCFCGVFVCTFFLNFYIDVQPLREEAEIAGMLILFEAQVATAKFTSLISGGVLTLVAAAMLIFYVKIFVDTRSKQLGIIKAMGYSEIKIALGFWVFGLSVFFGCAIGYGAGHAIMPFIYDQLSIEGLPEIAINYHPVLLLALVIAPTAAFSLFACAYAYFALRRPVLEMIRGRGEKVKPQAVKRGRDKPFLFEMCLKTLSSKKFLAFFFAFAGFCFSAMVQMGLSMEKLTSETMGYMILAIGVILAAVSMFMAVTSLIRGNVKNVSIMKAFGYSLGERSLAVLAGYVPFALLGFGVGTVYQYGLLQLMINIIFADVEGVPEYNFNVPVFFETLAAFVISYAAVTAANVLRINKISVKEVMLEN